MHGLGSEAGAALVEHPDVDLVSITSSAETGRWINGAGRRLAKVCLELGGKNALVVCDDADALDAAVGWALASAFSNAGQRCASASRILVFDGVYDAFRERLLAGVQALDVQPVISRESMERISDVVRRAAEAGANVLCAGERLDRPG